MAYARQYSSDPAARLAAELVRIREAAQAAGRRAAFILPVLDADPAADDPTNLWAFDDGRIRWRGTDGVVHEFWPRFKILTLSSDPAASSGVDIYLRSTDKHLRVRAANGTWVDFSPTASGSSSTSNDPGGSTTKNKQPQTAPKTFRKTYAPEWGRTLCPVHGVETGGELTYGRYSSTHGQRRVMLGFDDAQIRSDLAGASIVRVELHMRNTHSFANSGVQVRWGGHNKDAAPGSYSAVRRNVWSNHWPKVGDGTYWRGGKGDITWFGRAFRDNVIKGLVIDQLSDSLSYYGRMDWSSVRLRITYTK